ncbi:hypothetical protein OV207_04985 [Corallococcus sp. BB11-1]|uniref:hypothetical protein n=1 Tax=Corallococcus sp. BB11-1 TaxID=2996783 RepID=UPI00226EF62F|nr:hypothetical protein [Corallococcus sp. BB11-1]MCY1030802.1 hypothetical protein [Corallococcus sp. BB11-1]
MRAEDLISTQPTPEAVAEALRRLPAPPPEAVEALRGKFSATQEQASSSAWPTFLEAARRKRDSRYADAPTSHRPVVGPALVMAKRAFRLTFQPFINEALRRQVEFNEAILEALALIHEHQRVQARTQTLWRQEVEKRLEQLDAHLPRSGPEVVPPGKPSGQDAGAEPARRKSRRR